MKCNWPHYWRCRQTLDLEVTNSNHTCYPPLCASTIVVSLTTAAFGYSISTSTHVHDHTREQAGAAPFEILHREKGYMVFGERPNDCSLPSVYIHDFNFPDRAMGDKSDATKRLRMLHLSSPYHWLFRRVWFVHPIFMIHALAILVI